MSRLPQPVRKLGTRLLGSIPVRIRGGPNAGLRWSLASAGRGYRTGTFDEERVRAIVRLLRTGDRVWDVGAHKGYVTLAAARAVGPDGRVVAIEPAGANRALLERHLRWNDVRNVRLMPVAMGEADGETRIGGPGSSLTFSAGRGDEVVSCRSIGSLVEREGLPPPTVLKIDVEGSEAAVLRGGADHLGPEALIWVSLHGRRLYHECRAVLEGRGFRLFESPAVAALVADPSRTWRGDPEVLAVGPDRGIGDSEIRAMPFFRP